MNKENLVKSLFVFGGGFLLYMLVRSAKENFKPSQKKPTTQNTQNFVSGVTPSQENAKIVLTAYKMALKNKESASRLSELNKECLNEFGLRCYIDDKGQTIVCDVNGDTILTD